MTRSLSLSICVTDLVNGRAVPNVSAQGSHVNDLEGHYVQLRLLPLVRGRQRDGVESERVARFYDQLVEAVADCRHFVRRLLSVSVFGD